MSSKVRPYSERKQINYLIIFSSQHSTDPQYECKICGYRNDKGNLARHMKIHEPPSFFCEVCGELKEDLLKGKKNVRRFFSFFQARL